MPFASTTPDNMAVNNLKGASDQNPLKKKQLLGGMTTSQWAHILGVKLPKDPNTMDTSARGRSYGQKKKTQARLSSTDDLKDTQHKKGHCFTCNKQGHLSCNW